MEPTTPIDPAAMIATVAVLAMVVKGVVDAIRRARPGLDGLVIQIVAVLIGTAVAAAFDLKATEAILHYIGAQAARVPIAPVDYLITGGVLGLGAGFLAEITGRSGGPDPVVFEVDENGQPIH